MLEVHRAATQRNEGQEDEEREEAFFKRYLEFCRAKVSPRLSQPAADSLVSQYVELREQVRCSIPSVPSRFLDDPAPDISVAPVRPRHALYNHMVILMSSNTQVRPPEHSSPLMAFPPSPFYRS